MKTFIFNLFALVFLLQSFHSFAQPAPLNNNIFKLEQATFLRDINNTPTDSSIVASVAHYAESETNNIYDSIVSNKNLPFLEKEKAIRSLVYFMQETSRNIAKQKSDVYDIPAAVRSYRSVLLSILRQKPFASSLKPLQPGRAQLLAASFSQYKEHVILDDIAVYKRIAATPEFILPFLENKPDFQFADSLLVEAAAYDPMKIVFYLNKNKGIQDRIRGSKNIYVQQIVALSGDKNVSELLPFVKKLAENKITTAEIIEKRMDVLSYFQLLVNTLQESTLSNDASHIFLQPLRNGLRQKSLAFFVNEINDLHSSADPIRFASVKNLRPVDIYYIITSCDEELYTSSYLGLYKRLMGSFKDQSADSLFDLVKYDNSRIFLRLAANYNVLADFLRNTSMDRAKSVMAGFMGGIGTDTNNGLERAMDIGDSFGAVNSSPELSSMVQAELQSNLNLSKVKQQYLGIRLYTILLQVFESLRQEDGLKKLWSKLGDYETLSLDALRSKNGDVVQVVLFYGDEDGISSFKNFLQLYGDNSKWKVTENDNWISIRSISEQPLAIYANKPLDIKQELDVRAQDSLFAFLQQESLEPSVLVHRGHSYHLDKTLRRLKPSVRLAILGSCGSYNKSISIATINPDVQVIGSKKTGAKSINDPIIDMINTTLMNKKDLYWPELWKKLAARFSKDEMTLNLFNEYFPPSNNVSLFVLKLFNYENRAAYYAGTD